MHILLLRFSSLGDIVLQSQFCAWLKFIAPDSKLSFMCFDHFKDLVTDHKDIDHVLLYKKKSGLADIKSLKNTISNYHKESNIDLIIDLHGTLRSFMIKTMFMNIPSLSMDKRRIERFLLVKAKIDLLKKQPSLHSRLIKDFHHFMSEKKLETFISFNRKRHENNEIDFLTPKKIGEANKTDTIIIAPSASFETKRWPVESFKQLLDLLLKTQELTAYRFKILAGPSDDFCAVLDEKNPRVDYLQGKTSLLDSYKIIANSKLVIGNDSGMVHIAEANGVNAISIFGPTSESFGFGAHLENSHTISHSLWCRPCSLAGKKKCFRKKRYCMDMTTPKMILDKTLEVLC